MTEPIFVLRSAAAAAALITRRQRAGAGAGHLPRGEPFLAERADNSYQLPKRLHPIVEHMA